MKDKEKIDFLVGILDEVLNAYNNSVALPRLADELYPAIKKWQDARPGFIDPTVDLDQVRRIVCSVLGIQSTDFFTSNKRSAADARRIFVNIVLGHSNTMIIDIAAYLNNRHHSTVIHSRDSHADLVKDNFDYRNKYNEVLRAFNEQSNK